MALWCQWWLCGGYVFPAAGLNEILTFKIRFDLERQGQLPLKTTGILTEVLCTSGLNLVILAWMADELWCRQAPKGVNMDIYVKFDIEGQCRLFQNSVIKHFDIYII